MKKISIAVIITAVVATGMAFDALAQADNGFQYNSHGKRDPFAPLVDKDGEYIKSLYSSGSLQDLTLEGIVYEDGGESYAIIGGKVVREKDTVAGYTVYKISKDRVFIVKGETLHELTLPRLSRPKEESKK